MARKRFVRIRTKNQITLPSHVLHHLQLGENDYIQVEVTQQGTAQIAPVRLAVLGSPEARESNRRAEEDFKAGRYREFQNGEEFAKALFAEELSESSAKSRARSLEQIEREYIVAVLGATDWNPARAAAKLGWGKPRLKEKLRHFNITRESVK